MAGAPDRPPESDELTFLRYFFNAAGDGFGPADHDVYCILMENFERTHNLSVPREYAEGYIISEEDE